MLVLSRKQGERVIVGNDIEVTVVKVVGGRVHLGFTTRECLAAPPATASSAEPLRLHQCLP